MRISKEKQKKTVVILVEMAKVLAAMKAELREVRFHLIEVD